MTVSADKTKFKFPWEIRQLIILTLMGEKSGGITIQNDIRAEKIVEDIERVIGDETIWKTGEHMFGDMSTGLSEEVVQMFLFMILGKILRDNGIDSKDIRIALHNKTLISALEGAVSLLKTIN